jgi:hypothetical protein
MKDNTIRFQIVLITRDLQEEVLAGTRTETMAIYVKDLFEKDMPAVAEAASFEIREIDTLTKVISVVK